MYKRQDTPYLVSNVGAGADFSQSFSAGSGLSTTTGAEKFRSLYWRMLRSNITVGWDAGHIAHELAATAASLPCATLLCAGHLVEVQQADTGNGRFGVHFSAAALVQAASAVALCQQSSATDQVPSLATSFAESIHAATIIPAESRRGRQTGWSETLVLQTPTAPTRYWFGLCLLPSNLVTDTNYPKPMGIWASVNVRVFDTAYEVLRDPYRLP